MSYNGIGLSSVKGTATSGFVQGNASYVRPSNTRYRVANNKSTSSKKSFRSNKNAINKGNKDIQKHALKRRLENKLLEMRERLENTGDLTEDEIDQRVNDERQKQYKAWEEDEKKRLEWEKKQQERQEEAERKLLGQGEDNEDSEMKLLKNEADSGNSNENDDRHHESNEFDDQKQ